MYSLFTSLGKICQIFLSDLTKSGANYYILIWLLLFSWHLVCEIFKFRKKRVQKNSHSILSNRIILFAVRSVENCKRCHQQVDLRRVKKDLQLA